MSADRQAMNRYVVISKPDQTGYVILDRELWGYCTLSDNSHPTGPNLLPLEWRSRGAAEAWLHMCYRLWGNGEVLAPEGWRPFRKEESPWLQYRAKGPVS